jgi:hypothetical protein
LVYEIVFPEAVLEGSKANSFAPVWIFFINNIEKAQ